MTGIFASREKAVDGSPLTNPRMISNNVLLDVDTPDQEFTLSVMQMAQFIDHDLALSPFLEFSECYCSWLIRSYFNNCFYFENSFLWFN